MTTYYVQIDGQPRGPYTLAQLRAQWLAGTLTCNTLFAEPGDDFKPLAALAYILDNPSATTVQQPSSSPAAEPTLPSGFAPHLDTYVPPELAKITPRRSSPEPERKLLPAAALCFFAGFLGAHAFYAGRNVVGLCLVAFLICSALVVTNGPIPYAILGLVVLVDFLVIVSGRYEDRQGRPITA